MSSSVGLRVGFVGAGKMASALARGFLTRTKTGSKCSQVVASCPAKDEHLLKEMKMLGCDTTHSNRHLVQNSDVVLIAVKPHLVSSVLKEVKELITKDKLIVSIAAGIKITSINKTLDAGAKVARVMPNTPSFVGEGATIYTLGDNCSNSDGQIIEELFAGVGSECHPIAESLIDAATGISGSGPAYMYLIIEALADAGVEQGLPRDLSYKLAAQTMIGAGQMVRKTGKHPAALKDDVCSPGGATIAALHILEKNGMRNAIISAVEAATKRCSELGD